MKRYFAPFGVDISSFFFIFFVENEG